MKKKRLIQSQRCVRVFHFDQILNQSADVDVYACQASSCKGICRFPISDSRLPIANSQLPIAKKRKAVGEEIRWGGEKKV